MDMTAVGAALLGPGTRVLAAHGAATVAPFPTLLADPAWRADLARRRLLAVATPKARRLALATPIADGGALLLVSNSPSDAVFEFIATVDFAWDILHHLVTDRFEAMTVVNADARIAYLSPVHENFFGIGHGDAIGRKVREVIQNTRLHEVLKTGKPEIGRIQRMKGLDRVVSRVPIMRDGKILGAIGRVMFKGPEQVEALAGRVSALEREVAFYRSEAAALRGPAGSGLAEIVGVSPAIARLRREIAKVAPLDVPVLIQGESGTGKELVARALHTLSPRAGAPLVAVNAAALPAELVESELFGYAPGAFTGADRKGRKGRFEQAQGGTLFLDEIGDMPKATQVKLLRVLQERVVEPVGGDRPVPVDFRLVTATHRDLAGMIASQEFRADLFYRLSPVVLDVPRLAERTEDIPLLLRHFLRELAQRHGRAVPEVPAALDRYLASLAWPGNVRQLRHAVERALIFSDGASLGVADFAQAAEAPALAPAPMPLARAAPATLQGMADAAIEEALRRHGGNKRRAAAELGISRSHLYARLARAAQGGVNSATSA